MTNEERYAQIRRLERAVAILIQQSERGLDVDMWNELKQLGAEIRAVATAEPKP